VRAKVKTALNREYAQLKVSWSTTWRFWLSDKSIFCYSLLPISARGTCVERITFSEVSVYLWMRTNVRSKSSVVRLGTVSAVSIFVDCNLLPLSRLRVTVQSFKGALFEPYSPVCCWQRSLLIAFQLTKDCSVVRVRRDRENSKFGVSFPPYLAQRFAQLSSRSGFVRTWSVSVQGWVSARRKRGAEAFDSLSCLACSRTNDWLRSICLVVKRPSRLQQGVPVILFWYRIVQHDEKLSLECSC